MHTFRKTMLLSDTFVWLADLTPNTLKMRTHSQENNEGQSLFSGDRQLIHMNQIPSNSEQVVCLVTTSEGSFLYINNALLPL
jgi:hypothetical protein